MSLQRLRSGGLVVVLTGAGVSAESGIPTFRGEEGYWTIGSRHYHPQELATRNAFSHMPLEVWSWYLYRRSVCRAAQPNRGHQILGDLGKQLGERMLLVTQNVDGLHLRAGSPPKYTYEIHGNIDYFRCWNECPEGQVQRWPLSGFEDFPKERHLSPAEFSELRCPCCGGSARPHVLWFDECYDEEKYHYHSSRAAAHKASALISVGASGSTNLPMQMGTVMAQRGALLVDINPTSNPFAQMALESGGVWLREGGSTGLEKIWDVLKDAPT